MKYLIPFFLVLASCKTINEGAVAEQALGSGAICEDKWVMNEEYTFIVRCAYQGKRYDCLIRGSDARGCAVVGNPLIETTEGYPAYE
jgi:hypothetical protein